jgi:tetrahydromethanopterin S-methyltransferase subunit B
MPTAEPERENQPRAPEMLHDGGGRLPVPDPTTLTTEALRREVASLQVLIEQRLEAAARLTAQSVDSLKERSDEKEKRLEQQHRAMRSELQASVESALKLCNAQFALIKQQLDLIERQRVEQKQDTNAAVDAALTAQKEAVREQTTASELAISKSEASTAKQIEQIAAAGQTGREELRRSIDEVKERFNEVERTLNAAIAAVDTKANALNAQKVGAREDRSGLYAAIGAIAAVILLGITIVGFLAAQG